MLSAELKADFAYAIPVLASRDIKETIGFFIELGAEKSFTTDDGQYGGVLFGLAEMHFYQTTHQELLNNSLCRIQMKHVERLYDYCNNLGIVQRYFRKLWMVVELTT